MSGYRIPTDGKDLRTYLFSPRAGFIYDFLVDGSASYSFDQDVAAELYRVANWVRTAALINREFGRQSVNTSLALGVRQFLDLGCGLPAGPQAAVPDLHEMIAKTQQGCPVVYVDHDPHVYGYARCDLDVRPPHRVTPVHADLLDMQELLHMPEVTRALDLTQPVAAILHDCLPWNEDDDEVAQALAVLRAWLPEGSTLSITHLTGHWDPATVSALVAVYGKHGIRARPRTREQIAALFGNFIHRELGLAATAQWSDDGPFCRHPPIHSAAFAGLAVKDTARNLHDDEAEPAGKATR